MELSWIGLVVGHPMDAQLIGSWAIWRQGLEPFLSSLWCVSGIHLNARTQGFPAECCTVTRWSVLFTSPVLADRCSLIIAVYIPLNTHFLLLPLLFQAVSGSRWVGSFGREWGFILVVAIGQMKNISLSVSLFKAFANGLKLKESVVSTAKRCVCVCSLFSE